MKFFEKVDLMTEQINNLGMDMLEGFLTEDFDKLKKIFDTMDVLKPFLRDTKEFIILQQNRNSIEVHMEIKKSVENKGTKYMVDKDFTILTENETEDELGEIKFYFKNDKIELEEFEDFTDVSIKAKAIYTSYDNDKVLELYSSRNLDLEDISFFQKQFEFKNLFLNNNFLEIVKERKLHGFELDHIEIEII